MRRRETDVHRENTDVRWVDFHPLFAPEHPYCAMSQATLVHLFIGLVLGLIFDKKVFYFDLTCNEKNVDRWRYKI
jgi:hypothetical protein